MVVPPGCRPPPGAGRCGPRGWRRRRRLGLLLQLVEGLSGVLNVEPGEGPGDLGAGDHGDEGVGGELLDDDAEIPVGHFEAVEGSGAFAATQLELFDDVGDFLEAVQIPETPVFVFFAGYDVVAIPSGFPLGVRNDQKGGLFEEQDFVGLDGRGQFAQLGLDGLHVGDQHVDDGAPGLVQGLVPNARAEALATQWPRELVEVFHAFLK